MNENVKSDSPLHVSGPANDDRLRVPDTSMLPGSEKARPAAVGPLNAAVQGAHDTLDRFAESATPTVQRLGVSVSAAGESLHAKTDQLRVTRDEWVEGARETVRSNPLGCVVGALALGALIARITR